MKAVSLSSALLIAGLAGLTVATTDQKEGRSPHDDTIGGDTLTGGVGNGDGKSSSCNGEAFTTITVGGGLGGPGGGVNTLSQAVSVPSVSVPPVSVPSMSVPSVSLDIPVDSTINWDSLIPTDTAKWAGTETGGVTVPSNTAPASFPTTTVSIVGPNSGGGFSNMTGFNSTGGQLSNPTTVSSALPSAYVAPVISSNVTMQYLSSSATIGGAAKTTQQTSLLIATGTPKVTGTSGLNNTGDASKLGAFGSAGLGVMLGGILLGGLF